MLKDATAKYHMVGADPKNDKVIFSREHDPEIDIKPEDICFVYYSEDFDYIIGVLGGVQQDQHYYFAPASELLKEKINWKPLAKPEDQVLGVVIRYGNAYFLSRKDASNYKVLVSPIDNLDVANAKTLIPEGKHNIQFITAAKSYLFIVKSDGINNYIDQYDFKTGNVSELKLPISGTAWIYSTNIITNELLLNVTSWTQPRKVYDYNPVTGKSTISPFHVPVRYPGVENLTVEEVEVPGHDGVMVPVSLIYNKGLKKDGSNAVLLTGYGAYGSSATPYFSSMNLALLNRVVMIAEAHVRGGGEKGDKWYKGGFKTTKPNTWKDFISSAEWLIKNNYTSPGKIIGEGTSAGGILIGRAITERPDLFAAAISNVSCSNALRFENTPNGPNNAREFGTVKDSVECMALMEMDAVLHVKPGTKYPAVMCVAGMNDPRVIAWQPGKFAAALQHASTSGKPVLLQVNYDNGHFTEDKTVTYRNFANMFSFGLWQAGHKDFQPNKGF